MDFCTLLHDTGIPPQEVAVCLHKPGDPIARQQITIMAEERPDLFEAYQSTHGSIQESTVRNRPFFASFLMTAPAELTFVGLYARHDLGPQSADDFLTDSHFCEMLKRADGHKIELRENAERLAGRRRFKLDQLPNMNSLSKRLVVADPGGRNYVRLADTTELKVIEIKRIARIVPVMPPWERLTLSSAELTTLPRDWAIRLSEWCGIYLIVDEADGARYVGSAYGEQNILGRWRAHVAGATGVTAELSKRSTSRFRFSILQLLSPSAPVEDVTRVEHTWIDRLDTRRFGLNS